jgi:hypothetical protein
MARSRMTDLLQLRSSVCLAGASLTALAIALAGCDSGTQAPDAPAPEAVEYSAPAAPAKTPAPDKTAQVQDQDLPAGFEATIPPNFPSDVPVLPDARPVLGKGGNVDGSERTGVQLSTDKSPEDVVSYYQRELADGGWQLEESPGNAVKATKDGATVMLFAAPDASGGTSVFMITEDGGK